MIGRGVGWFYMMQAVVLGVIWGAIFSTQGTLFSELFPAKVRYTGLSVGYQVAAAIAGFGPLIWTAMAESYGPSPLVFGGFMMAGLAISWRFVYYHRISAEGKKRIKHSNHMSWI